MLVVSCRMMTRGTILISITIMGLILSLFMGGCAQPLNSKLTLGGNTLPPSFDPAPKSLITPLSSRAETFLTLCAQSPDRDRWSMIRYHAPFDGVVHDWPMLPNRGHSTKDTPRHYGNYPTLISATQYQTTHPINNVLLIPMELGRSFFASPLMSLRFAPDLFDRPALSPMIPYKRTLQRYTWTSVNPQSIQSESDQSSQPHIEPNHE